MKKFEDYQKEYSEVIESAKKKAEITQSHIAYPSFEMWSYFKFTQDNNISADELTSYHATIEKIKDYDTNLYALIKSGEEVVANKFLTKENINFNF